MGEKAQRQRVLCRHQMHNKSQSFMRMMYELIDVLMCSSSFFSMIDDDGDGDGGDDDGVLVGMCIILC